ncbi:uncharacterized protein [Antedon mediterranea]|uniref:uncharacterized protein n=1 Tax=Antedon mediterranea TaxID=105859 RepID=UPI003AF5A035
MYVNDMESALSCKLLLYADDSAIVVSDKSVANIQNVLSKELKSINSWLLDNRLSLHLGKTYSILFGSKRKLRNQQELKVTCNDYIITNKPTVSYLGLELDNNLTGDYIGKSVIKKVNSRVKFLYRNRKYLTFRDLKLLANSLVLCLYDYACSVWYSGLKKTLKVKLQTAQNKTVRCILGLEPRDHIGANELNKLNWLPVDLRVKQIKLCHMYRIINGLSPTFMNDGISRANVIHQYNTRFATQSIYRPYIGNHSQTTFVNTAITSWNHLPKLIQCSETINQFKRNIRKHLKEVMLERL